MVRDPGRTLVTEVSDPSGDVNGSSRYDLTGARFVSIADQFTAELVFQNSVDPRDLGPAEFVEGQLLIDSDQSLATGSIPFPSNIPTWGGDRLLSFSLIGSGGGTFSLYFNAFDPSIVLGSWNNDGRWVTRQNVLSVSGSRGIFDAWSEAYKGGTPPEGLNISQRVPTAGRMDVLVQMGGYFPPDFRADDILPNGGGVVDTATGRALPPY